MLNNQPGQFLTYLEPKSNTSKDITIVKQTNKQTENQKPEEPANKEGVFDPNQLGLPRMKASSLQFTLQF